jgi:tetratricopeptide (TPR) repeat protein
MIRRLLPVILLVLLAAPAWSLSGQAPPAQNAAAAQSEHVRQGVGHFERAFYDLTPHKRDLEAAQEFDQAIAQFELELKQQPSSAVAHQYLGRIYSLRKDYKRSAQHYDRLSEIEPLNVDACVLAALAYGESGDYAQARARLLDARRRTSDPAALETIAGYLVKVDKLIR